MIYRLEVENYKSIEKCDLSFKEMNVLIGKNGAGKTTLISIINMLKKLASGMNINDVVGEVAPFGNEFFNVNTHDEHAKFTLEVQTPQNERFLYSFTVIFGKREPRNETAGLFYFDSESLHKLNHDDKELIFQRTTNTESTIKVGVPGGEEDIPLKVDPSVLVLSAYAQGDAKSVADTLSSYSVIWIDTVTGVNHYEIVSSNKPNLGTIDGVAVSLYLKDRRLFDEAIDAIKSIIPGFTPPDIAKIPSNFSSRSEKTKPDDEHQKIANYIVSWSDSNYSRNYGISRISLSGGNNRVIFLILSLYNSEAKSCFVAEEIENGMHLSRIAELIDRMRMIIKNRKIQLFFTTHNHKILDYLLPGEVIFAKLDKDGSKYTRLSETKEYADIEKDLGRAPSSTEVVESGLLFS